MIGYMRIFCLGWKRSQLTLQHYQNFPTKRKPLQNKVRRQTQEIRPVHQQYVNIIIFISLFEFVQNAKIYKIYI